MAPPLPPKPTIGPLVRRSLFAAALGVAGCGQKAVRIGPTPRIGPPPYDPTTYSTEPPADAAGETPTGAVVDAGPGAEPAAADADAGAAAAADAASAVEVPDRPPPIRIGPPVRIGALQRPIEKDPRPIRIGAELEPRSSTGIRGSVVDAHGRPLANASLRIELASGTRVVTTDARGAFTLEGVAPGEHAAVVSARGFAPVEVRLTAARRAGDAVVTLAPAGD